MEFNPANARYSISVNPDTLFQLSILYIIKPLESVDGAKYLGVNLSKDLSWNTHVNNINSTAY